MPSNFRDKNGQDPFSDEHGQNPYAEDGQEVQPDTDDSPYAASDAPPVSHQLGDFEAVLPHRGRQILRWAVGGLVVALAGLLVWLLIPTENAEINSPDDFAWLMLWDTLPIATGAIGISVSLPACFLANKDLHAMRMGAVDPAGKSMTSLGAVIGLAGILVGVLGVFLALPSVAN
jgi:hypothetical protein